ncbi:unannotated protein [freshwater metagenome]|uniref:Unannotated protein n=1 Tax=freshwater metagenome TaxID=449393 RepID=A0A6J5ZZ94_9ZZZZ
MGVIVGGYRLAVANHKKTQKPRKPQHHLPKVGTPQNDAYRLKRSREDIVDFGLMHPGNGLLTKILGGLAVIFVLGMLVSFIFLT